MQEYLTEMAKGQEHHLTEALSKRPRSETHKHAKAEDAAFQRHVPVDFSPLSLGESDNTQAFEKGTNVLTELYDVHQKMLDAAVAIQNKAALADRIEPEVARVTKRAKEGIDVLERHISFHDAEIKKELSSGMGPLHQEIRQYVRSLEPAERRAFLTKTIQGGEKTVVQAIFAVPSFLAGLELDDTYFALREMGEEVLAPKSVKEKKTAINALNRAQRSLENFETTMRRNLGVWRSGDAARLEAFMASIAPKVS